MGKFAAAAVRSQNELLRRKSAQRRIDLYKDDCEHWLNVEIDKIFLSDEVKKRIKAFSKIACSQSLFKRIVDEISRPVYSRPPMRKITAGGQKPFALLEKETRLNQKYDRSVRLANAANAVFLHYWYSSRLKKVISELWTPDMVTVIPDPDDPTLEAAIIVDQRASINGESTKIYSYWDDTEHFKFLADGRIIAGFEPQPHGYDRMPIVPIHRVERWGAYWDDTSGQDLENAQLSVLLLSALRLKLHKSQGEKQFVIEGDAGPMSKNQTLDGEAPLHVPDGTTLSLLDLRSDANHYTSTIDSTTTTAGANHGLNRERLNARTTNPGDDTSLNERRDDIIKVYVDVEHEVFDVLKMVSQQHDDPLRVIPMNAKLKRVDFGEIEERYDMKTRLEIWDLLEAKGYRSPIDSIRALNAEIKDESEAKAEIIENMMWRGWIVAQQRELNAPQNTAKDGAGLTPQENGSTGPLVRDGEVDKNQLEKIQERGRAGEQ
ncbi:MAG: phage portal protein [Alphaproteobacteria bacterium]